MTRSVQFFTITEHHQGQRIDNFLVAHLKGVPKSHIYQMVRSGGVRVNKKRVKPSDRLEIGDIIRVPPVTTLKKGEVHVDAGLVEQLKKAIIYEDDRMIVIDKPSGLAVHSGSGQKIGVIEAFRKIYENPNLDLAHRIDLETSGCLVIAKTRNFLKEFHELFREQKVKKTYVALLQGKMREKEHLETMAIDEKAAETLFVRKQVYENTTLVEAYPKSGRTHQIRVHASDMGHPIIGDKKYGETPADRLYLHALRLEFTLGTEHLTFEAPLNFKL